jgi:hypothetical protein
MTIHEAVKEARETHRMLKHSTWPHFIPVDQLDSLEIPGHLALSNAWEVEPKTRLIRPKDLREAAIPVLRKYIAAGHTLDGVLKELQEAVFKGAT